MGILHEPALVDENWTSYDRCSNYWSIGVLLPPLILAQASSSGLSYFPRISFFISSISSLDMNPLSNISFSSFNFVNLSSPPEPTLERFRTLSLTIVSLSSTKSPYILVILTKYAAPKETAATKKPPNVTILASSQSSGIHFDGVHVSQRDAP